MGTLAVIPARGGSKGIPLKNIAIVGDKPLLAWTIEAALGARHIDRTVVTTDHDGIAKIAEEAGAEVVMRPFDLADDTAPTRPVIEHAWREMERRGYRAELIATLQPTSPFRKAHHIDSAIELMERRPEADSLVSLQKIPHQFSPESLMTTDGAYTHSLDEAPVLRRQDKLTYWARNGAAIYLTRSNCISKFVWGGAVLAFPMDRVSSIDVDGEEDLHIANALFLASNMAR